MPAADDVLGGLVDLAAVVVGRARLGEKLVAAREIPAETPYIFADPALVETWRQRLAAQAGFKVGIAWQGNRQYVGDLMARCRCGISRRWPECRG